MKKTESSLTGENAMICRGPGESNSVRMERHSPHFKPEQPISNRIGLASNRNGRGGSGKARTSGRKCRITRNAGMTMIYCGDARCTRVQGGRFAGYKRARKGASPDRLVERRTFARVERKRAEINERDGPPFQAWPNLLDCLLPSRKGIRGEFAPRKQGRGADAA